jgi:hypothetical protein
MLTTRLRDDADDRGRSRRLPLEVLTMLTGFLLGIVIGLLIGPLVRSWLAWREYVDASREVRLHDEILRLMSESLPPGQEPAEGPLGPPGERS